MARTGLEPQFVRGHRVTDGRTLDVVVKVLSEEVNAGIVRRLRELGGKACTAFQDGQSLLRARRKLMTVANDQGVPEEIDLGFVGEVTNVDAEHMLEAAQRGAVVAVPPIGQDEGGQLYNVNADTAAAAVAGAVGAEKVVFLSNVHGIMADPEDPESLLSTIQEDQVQSFIDKGIITGGMLPKVAACLAALKAGVPKAHIVDGRLPHSLLLEIFTDKGIGTQILG
jgi:acetylglutamate kinase